MSTARRAAISRLYQLPGGAGGKGAHLQATVALTPGATLKMRVGGKGEDDRRLLPLPHQGGEPRRDDDLVRAGARGVTAPSHSLIRMKYPSVTSEEAGTRGFSVLSCGY
jgi:hypothetical protein